MSKRLIGYIDGFNLYRGMLADKMRRLLWLDLRALVENLSPKDAHVVAVKYVTARILNMYTPGDVQHAKGEESRKRQNEFIEAQLARGVNVFEGKFKRRYMNCPRCQFKWLKPEEKASDVHLATQLLTDAFHNMFDVAMLITGDADICPAVHVVAHELSLPVIVAFPPKRVLNELKTVSSSFIHINRRIIARSQLPETFSHQGHAFSRPQEWS